MHERIALGDIPHLWRGDSVGVAQRLISSGFPALDAALGGGWPMPALLELSSDQSGIGELRLLLPLLEHSSRLAAATSNPQRVLWLNPPYALQASALRQHGVDPGQQWLSTPLTPRQTAWAMELALKSGACVLVIAWLMQANAAALRRIKLASSTCNRMGVLFRPAAAMQWPSPANVRIELRGHDNQLHLTVRKAQGARPSSLDIDPSRASVR
jgi:hypothetical protein